MKKVSNSVVAVVVTYNRKELLKECIEALLEQNYKDCVVLVVDNASTDGTEKYIKKYVDGRKVIYKNTGENLGGAGGFNFGMKEAYKLGCKYIWLMDDDCIVHKDSLSELIEADKKLKGNYGFLSSKVLWKDGSLCEMNKQKRTFSKWLKDFDTNYQTIALGSFVSFFLKTATVKKYGLPIKEFFIWTDDWEYARRISRNEKCYYISSSIVTHKSRENIGASIATANDRLERFNYLYRNDRVLYRREGIKGWFLLRMRLLLHVIRILKSDKKDKKDRIAIIRKASKEGKRFNPGIEMAREDGQKIKIVEFFGEPLNYGGQEAFIKNVYENINKDNFDFTFITPFECQNSQLKEMIKKNGDHLIVDNQPFESKLRKKYIVKTAKKHINNKCDVLHIHSGSVFTLSKVSKIAKKKTIRKVIVHSHAGGKITLKYKIIKAISDRTIPKNADYFFACSELAGKWKYPKSVLDSESYRIIKNGINLEKYKYSERRRQEYRKKFGLHEEKIIINVGRYSAVKNQLFIIDIFAEVLKDDGEARLIIAGGDGELLDVIKSAVKEKGLEKSVSLLLNRDDICELLNMSDVFILPSLWEGLPFTGIEAQASGMPCIFSDRITNELDITKSYNKLPLEAGEKIWAKKITELFKEERSDNTGIIKECGYDISSICSFLEKIYGS